MPVAAPIRRERRALQKKFTETEKTHFGYCRNCGKRFQVVERLKGQKKFCNQQCRNEYHSHGSAFGPLKTKLENLARKLAADEARKLREEFLGKLDDLRLQINDALKQIDR